MKKLVIIFFVIISCNSQKRIEEKRSSIVSEIPKEIKEKKVNIKLLEGVWAESIEENALFYIEKDSITYVESIEDSYFVKLSKDTLYISFDNFIFKGEVLKLNQDSLVFKGDNEIIRLYRRNE